MKKQISQQDLKNYISEQVHTFKLKESITGDVDMDFGRTNYSKDDYIKGVSELEANAIDTIKDKLANIIIDYAKIQKEDVKKIADFLIKTFGTTKPELNKDNAIKLSKALGLDSILSEGFKEGENIGVKIIGRIKQLLGINIYAWAGIPLAGVMGYLFGAPAAIISLIGGWALMGIFTKIMEKFGYGDSDTTDVASIGNYRPGQDIRNKENSYTMENKKITKESLMKYIKEQSQNLYNLHVLKEEKNKIENDLKVLSEGKKKYSDKASEFIGKEISHLQKDKGYKHDRAVAAAINVAKDKGYKVPAKNESEAPSTNPSTKKKSAVIKKAKLNEGLSEKGVALVQKWIEEKGAREAAVKMIDSVLTKKLGLSSSDLGDTAIFANGLDEIESMLIEGDYNAAYEIARDTAMEMIEDEGGGDLFN
jgi:acyl carrier protein